MVCHKIFAPEVLKVNFAVSDFRGFCLISLGYNGNFLGLGALVESLRLTEPRYAIKT